MAEQMSVLFFPSATKYCLFTKTISLLLPTKVSRAHLKITKQSDFLWRSYWQEKEDPIDLTHVLNTDISAFKELFVLLYWAIVVKFHAEKPDMDYLCLSFSSHILVCYRKKKKLPFFFPVVVGFVVF